MVTSHEPCVLAAAPASQTEHLVAAKILAPLDIQDVGAYVLMSPYVALTMFCSLIMFKVRHPRPGLKVGDVSQP